ncbi:hypothetical protein Dimus_039245 [Dionaea muscipula]
MHPTGIEKSAFAPIMATTNFSSYLRAYKCPSTFQPSMNHIFEPFLRKFVLVFFDDILVYSTSWELHLSHLAVILGSLAHHMLVLRNDKCSFGQTLVAYLGHIITRQGVHADPAKIAAMID